MPIVLTELTKAMNLRVPESRSTEGHAESAGADAQEPAEAAEDIAALYTWANLHGAKFLDIAAVRCEDGSPARPLEHEHQPVANGHNGLEQARMDAASDTVTSNGHKPEHEAAGEAAHDHSKLNGDRRALETMLLLAHANGLSKEKPMGQDAPEPSSHEPRAIAHPPAGWRETALRNPAEWIPGWKSEDWDAEWYKQGIVDWRRPQQSESAPVAAASGHTETAEQTEQTEQMEQMEPPPNIAVEVPVEPLSAQEVTLADSSELVTAAADNVATEEQAAQEADFGSEADSTTADDAEPEAGADTAAGLRQHSPVADLVAPTTSYSSPWPLPKPELRWYAGAAHTVEKPASAASQEPGRAQEVRVQELRVPEPVVPPNRPQWLYESEIVITEARMASPVTSSPAGNPLPLPLPAGLPSRAPMTDTLQQSRERLASRWFALKGVFDGPNPEQIEAQPVRHKEPRPPVLALFSLAGGVGKTSTVATLGRALASLGEKTLLTDTTSYGLLPFYFGARELRPGAMRTFTPPGGSTDAPIQLINFDVESKPADVPMPPEGQDWLIEEILRRARGINRIVVDMATASATLMRRMLQMGPVVLVPVSPDLNSVISLPTAEQFFQNQTDADGMPVKVYYLLNQFDAAQPLHLDVREVLRQQLGERLLPFVLRRSTAVSEALAEGMTVMDYAPNSPVAEDYLTLATWVRNTSAPASAGFRGVRWTEQQ